MLITSPRFDARADARMRPLAWSLFISFAREVIDETQFFTVGVSTVGGPDIIKGEDTVLQLWDKYRYLDYSDRVLTMEWSQSMDPLYSVQSAMADIVMNNYDNYLSGENFALPYRPIRLGAGFGNKMTGGIEILPQFIGLTEKAPVITEVGKTVSYHALDFLASLYNRPLNEAVLLQNLRTDEILDALLQAMGLSPTQYDLDMAFNTIPIVYFPPDTKFGDAAQQLMQAEMGRLYMSETGRITFKNRHNFPDASVWTFDGHNVISYETTKQDDVKNVVEITSNVLEVQPLQKYWELTTATEVPAGSSIDVWASFNDPVTSVDLPVYFASATTSLYTANTAADGSGTASSDLTVSATRFATSYKMTYANATGSSIWLTTIQLFATPAKAVRTIYVREQDDASVLQNDEQVLPITNNFFTDEVDAKSKAMIILADMSTARRVQKVTVKGNPALQINDAITLTIRKRTFIAVQGDMLADVATAYDMTLSALEALNPLIDHTVALTDGQKVNLGVQPESYIITGISNHLLGPSFPQDLTLRAYAQANYFTVGISLVGGTDQIAP